MIGGRLSEYDCVGLQSSHFNAGRTMLFKCSLQETDGIQVYRA